MIIVIIIIITTVSRSVYECDRSTCAVVPTGSQRTTLWSQFSPVCLCAFSASSSSPGSHGRHFTELSCQPRASVFIFLKRYRRAQPSVLCLHLSPPMKGHSHWWGQALSRAFPRWHQTSSLQHCEKGISVVRKQHRVCI